MEIKTSIIILILRATVRNLIGRKTMRLGFVHLWTEKKTFALCVCVCVFLKL